MTTAFDPGFQVVPKPAQAVLSDRQLADYRAHRERLLEWALTIGKNPEHAEGYAETTVHGRAYRLDQFYRWVWTEFDGYTTDITHEHADAWMRELAYGDDSQAHKAAHQKSIKMLFRWRAWEFGDDEWEPEVHFSSNTGSSNPKDYLTKDERRRVREASLEFGGVPSYNSLSPEERDRWKIHLAQRFEMPKRDVGPDEFKRANSWKIPSLMWTALDAGLRPVEVERATVQWVDVQNQLLRIPRDESAKSFDNWTVSLTERTVTGVDYRNWPVSSRTATTDSKRCVRGSIVAFGSLCGASR